MPVVFDASVLLALIFNEPGAERAQRSLSLGVISSVNLSEVIATLVSRGATSADTTALIDDLPLDVEVFTLEDADVAGLLRAHTCADKTAWPVVGRQGLPRFGPALGRRGPDCGPCVGRAA